MFLCFMQVYYSMVYILVIIYTHITHYKSCWTVYSYSNSNNSFTYFHWKSLALAGIWTRYLPGTKPICYQLSYLGLDLFPISILNFTWYTTASFFPSLIFFSSAQMKSSYFYLWASLQAGVKVVFNKLFKNSQFFWYFVVDYTFYETCLVFYKINFAKGGIIIWPIQLDRMNMTEKCEYDQKDHTDKH